MLSKMTITTTPEPTDWKALLQKVSHTDDPVQCVREFAIPVDELKQLAITAEVGRPYGRKVLYEGELGEVLLVRWCEGKFCALHDHGVGAGVIWFVEGDFDEEFWKWSANRLTCEAQVVRSSGDCCSIGEKVIHRVRARRGGLSLHFYIPSSAGMRIFDVEGARTLLVEDDCGAWIDESKVKKATVWD